MSVNHTPYVYRISWIHLDKHYYGVRYSKSSYLGDIWKEYFTSSRIVEEFRKKNGEPNKIKIIRAFNSSDDAIKFETKLLRRLNVARNKRFLNGHTNKSFSPKFGKDNAICNETVKHKMISTKIRRNLIKFIRIENYVPEKKHIERIKQYIKYIDENNPYCVLSRKILKERLELCYNITPKPYPKGRKGGLRGPIPKISEARRGKRWFKNDELKKTKMFIPGEEPDGWIHGMLKNTPNNNTPEVRKKISISQRLYRQNESANKSKKRLDRYHATIEKRRC